MPTTRSRREQLLLIVSGACVRFLSIHAARWTTALRRVPSESLTLTLTQFMTSRDGTRLERLRRTAASAGILTVVGLLTLTFALPSPAPRALAGEARVSTMALLAADAQTLEVAEQVQGAEAVRGDYGVTTYADVLRERYSRGYFAAVGSDSWTGPVRWPFPTQVRMTDGFGPRAAPCSGCSTMHRGIDLLPGAGTPIFAIADGVVSGYQEGWGYGSHVFIDHQIDGQQITSLYAHMQTGSSPLVAGDHVSVGELVGLVGSTGATTAPHLHLEIRIDGVAIDPLPWLFSKTGR